MQLPFLLINPPQSQIGLLCNMPLRMNDLVVELTPYHCEPETPNPYFILPQLKLSILQESDSDGTENDGSKLAANVEAACGVSDLERSGGGVGRLGLSSGSTSSLDLSIRDLGDRSNSRCGLDLSVRDLGDGGRRLGGNSGGGLDLSVTDLGDRSRGLDS